MARSRGARGDHPTSTTRRRGLSKESFQNRDERGFILPEFIVIQTPKLDASLMADIKHNASIHSYENPENDLIRFQTWENIRGQKGGANILDVQLEMVPTKNETYFVFRTDEPEKPFATVAENSKENSCRSVMISILQFGS